MGVSSCFFARLAGRRAGRAVIGARGPGADASATPAPGATADDTSGVVFIFDTSTGAMLLKLQPSDAHGSHLPSCLFFGAALAISDRVVVVGAPRARPPCVPSGGMLSGAVFVFGTSEAGVLSNATAASFNQTARLVPPESALEGGLEFGSSVGIVTTVWRTTSLPRSLLAVGAFLMHTLLTHNTQDMRTIILTMILTIILTISRCSPSLSVALGPTRSAQRITECVCVMRRRCSRCHVRTWRGLPNRPL